MDVPDAVYRLGVVHPLGLRQCLVVPAVVMATEWVVRWQGTANRWQAWQGLWEQLWVICLETERSVGLIK